eukprot:TRINITY_DN67056_c6_g1_i1.p1 TRINITY_DN67056_c6_g1~~TRINITY_DN67056_c6_g1_i1.p1  ORF type:complete len:230 (-),score=117.15 TRINITY_DN67056_c6_g1_i1:954-1643(-)
MTLFHFFNCAMLAYGPSVVLFNSSRLPEYSAKSTVAYGGLGFAASAVVKGLLLATFMTAVDDVTAFDLTHELGKALVGCLDLVSVGITLQRAPGRLPKALRVLAVGLGWGLAEALLSYLIPLWMGARGMEFDWQYVRIGITANVNIVMHVAFVAVVWLYTRQRAVPQAWKPLIVAIAAARLLLPMGDHYLQAVLGFGVWDALVVRSVLAVVSAVVARSLLLQYLSSKDK